MRRMADNSVERSQRWRLSSSNSVPCSPRSGNGSDLACNSKRVALTSKPPGARSSATTVPSSRRTEDSKVAPLAASRLASSATPALTVHCTVPEPSRRTTKAILPAERWRWTQPRSRTAWPVLRPARMSATLSKAWASVIGRATRGLDKKRGYRSYRIQSRRSG